MQQCRAGPNTRQRQRIGRLTDTKVRGFMVTETNNEACAQLQLALVPLSQHASQCSNREGSDTPPHSERKAYTESIDTYVHKIYIPSLPVEYKCHKQIHERELKRSRRISRPFAQQNGNKPVKDFKRSSACTKIGYICSARPPVYAHNATFMIVINEGPFQFIVLRTSFEMTVLSEQFCPL